MTVTKRFNMEMLQERAGLIETDKGIVTQAINDTDLEILLSPFANTVDYQLFFSYANRLILGKYSRDNELNLPLLRKSIYHALKSNEYNLRTLIDTTNLEYDPIDNYEINETINTTNKGTDNTKYGEQVQITSTTIGKFDAETVYDLGKQKETRDVGIGEKSYTETIEHGDMTTTGSNNTTNTIAERNNTKTDKITYGESTEDRSVTSDKGEQINTKSDNIAYGSTTETRDLTSNKGDRVSSTDEDVKVSAYNASDYKPSSVTSTSQTQDAVVDTEKETTTNSEHTDTHSINETLGSKTDKDTEKLTKNEHIDTHEISEHLGNGSDTTTVETSETVNGYTDTKTRTDKPYDDTDIITKDAVQNTENRTENARNIDNNVTTKMHEDVKDTTNTGETIRHLKGRYGFTTIQSMIEAERNLANLNIVERIIAIVVRQICEGVLYVC